MLLSKTSIEPTRHNGGLQMKKAKLKEQMMQIVFLISASISILAVALICIFIFINGIPAMAEVGIFRFL